MQQDKHHFSCKNGKEIPDVMSSGMSPGSSIQSRAKRCWGARGRLAVTPGTRRAPGRSPGRQRDMGREVRWLQVSLLAQRLWQSMLHCKYLRKNLALGTFKDTEEELPCFLVILMCILNLHCSLVPPALAGERQRWLHPLLMHYDSPFPPASLSWF